MTKPERELLSIRFFEIELALADIEVGRVVDGNPAEVEAALHAEQDAIEYRLGMDSFERRDSE